MTKKNKVVLVTVMILSMSLINFGVDELHKLQDELKTKCSIEVSTEKWKINRSIMTVGNVSGDTIEEICEIIQNEVPSEAWNFVSNSGGRIIVLEDSDIRDYIVKEYKCDVSEVPEEKPIKGYCPYFEDEVGILQKVDIVISADGVKDSLLHEFCHALDYSHDYRNDREFKKIYKRADEILNKLDIPQDKKDYYSSKSTEFFAEMCARYIEGDLVGIDSKLEKYMESIVH